MIEFLNILNITNEDIVIANKNTIYESIFISTSYTHDIDSNLPPRKEIYEFYKDIVSSVINNDIETPKKIYVSRRTWLHCDYSNIGTNYTTRRKLINENELVEKLIKEGYTEIFTEKLSTIDKILYFSNATHVVGAIGGGISNVLFSPKETILEAIVSPTFLDVNYRFKYSLDCVNVTYNYNTKHIENTEFKTYMRVKTKDNKIIGEIEKINDNKLLISYTEGFNVGWNFNNKYNEIELDINDVIKLDNGLNSPWKIIFD
jgi:capsular polysaccharide biosynthesis protein